MCLSGTKDLMRVGRKWKMINIQVTFRLRKPTKTFRKSEKLFAKINVWVWEWLQTWLVLPVLQRDSATNLAEEAAESLEEQRLDAASGQCPSSQRPWTTSIFADLAPSDLFLYTELKSVLKGTHFPSVWRGEGKNGTASERPGVWWAIALLWTMEDTNAAVCR